MNVPLNSEKVTEIVGGECNNPGKGNVISQIEIDSRHINRPEETLFVALKGAKFDGHEFITKVYEQGVRVFLTGSGNSKMIKLLPDATFIQVPNTLKALQQLAKYQRENFKNPVIGITGSNGKTIVKEWLGQVLANQFPVAKSPKSYNSQVGVPLSVFGIAPFHKVAILEAGISTRGEMTKLAEIIQPDLGIFTNIGTAHEEGFESEEEKIAEKALLFKNTKFLIYCLDHVKLNQYLSTTFPADRLIAWSQESGAELVLSVKKEDQGAKIFMVKENLGLFTFKVDFNDQASLENVRHVISAALVLGLKPKEIQNALDHLRKVDMRLTLKDGINGCLLIDDTYNNDLAGLKIALEFMAAQRPKNRKVLLLSDLPQLGDPERTYREVAGLIRFHQIDLLIGVGEEIKALENQFSKDQHFFFSDTASLLAFLPKFKFENDLILITGARKFGFEAIVRLLQQRIHGTSLEINLNALTHNYNFYKSKLNPNTKVMVMVKAFAYGGGASEIANHLQYLRADYLAVAYTDEGVALRKEGIHLPIMVLNPVQDSFLHLHEYDLEPVVFSSAYLREVGNYCRRAGIGMKVHLDLDTGMHRLGFEEHHLSTVFDLLDQFPELKVQSIYTHLVGADESEHNEFSLQQIKLFQKMAGQIVEKLGCRPLCHALNSAGILRFPEYQMDMVRLGIGLYGVEVSGIYANHLKEVSTLKTTISQIKQIKKGESIGYSRKGRLPEAGQIATIAIGYADGYDRRFSNGKGFVMIQGKKAKIVGNVCMDMCMVDVTGMEVQEGDEVLIYGPGISLEELAQSIGTIPYELMTNISSRVKRVYYLD